MPVAAGSASTGELAARGRANRALARSALLLFLLIRSYSLDKLVEALSVMVSGASVSFLPDTQK
jgi:hypothetical protein